MEEDLSTVTLLVNKQFAIEKKPFIVILANIAIEKKTCIVGLPSYKMVDLSIVM